MGFKKSLLITNGKIANGTGSSLFKANIYVTDDKINKITNLQPEADGVIDADGLIVAPGFVNIHDHSDSTLLLDGRADNLVRQGITTTVTGNCGYSLAPIVEEKLDLLLKNWLFPLGEIKIEWRTFEEYLSRLEKASLSINVAPLVGHGTIRINALGVENRQPTREELAYMRKMVSDAMETGAFGTFPLLFRKYVRGETLKTLPEEEGFKVLSLEEAVRRVTTLPASRLKLKNRGVIKEGAFADIVIFDADKIQDTATYRNPFKYPRGVEYVIINGETVVERERHTNKRPGRVIRRS